jgi:hypothetical protein
MVGENRQLVTDEPVEVQDFRRITDHSRRINREYTSNSYRKTEGCPHVTGWTCKH